MNSPLTEENPQGVHHPARKRLRTKTRAPREEGPSSDSEYDVALDAGESPSLAVQQRPDEDDLDTALLTIQNRFPAEQQGDIPAATDSPHDDSSYGPGVFRQRRQRFEAYGAGRGQASSSRQHQDSLSGAHTVSSAIHEIMVVRKTLSDRAQHKAHEKEISWGNTPDEHRDLYRRALDKQWKEFLYWKAVDPLSVEDSIEIGLPIPTSSSTAESHIEIRMLDFTTALIRIS